jgi:4-amino-4-deoxy-L-arabinose transferase-like glycosyltransferase
LEPSATVNRFREVWILLCICAVALTVRLLYLGEWAATPLFHAPMGDELNFHDTALALLGRGATVDVFMYQPLYSFFLASVYSVFGEGAGLVRSVHLVIGIGNCLLFYGLGREIGGRWAGRLAALMAALCGPLVFFEGMLLAPGLCVPLLAGAFWCLVAAGKRDRPWLAAPAGLLFGVALMGRPNLAAMLPVAALFLLLRPWPWKRRLLAAGLAVLLLVAGLLPAWIHNASRGESFTLVSSSGGINFYIGNNPQATGRFHLPRGEKLEGISHWDFARNTRVIAEQDAGRSLSPSEVSSYWYGRGLSFWGREPLQALGLAGKKLLLAVNSDEMPVHHPYVFAQEVAPVLRWLLPFGVLFPFAVLGVWWGRKQKGIWLLGGCALAYLLTLVVFFVADRLRIMLLPLLLPLAALGMLKLAAAARDWRWRSNWPQLAVLVLAFGLTQAPLTPDSFRARALAQGYNRMGKAEGERGNLEAAEGHFKKALELAGPADRALAGVNLGRVYELRGDMQKAHQVYLQVARAARDNRTVRVLLARMAERRGDPQEAIRWWEEVAGLLPDPRPAREHIRRLKEMLQE